MHVQSVQKCCFSFSNMQICDALVVVALFACLRASFAKALKLLPLISARPKCHTFVHPVPQRKL